MILIIFLTLLYISEPYLLSSGNKLYEQGVVEMKQGIVHDMIKPDHLLKAIIYFRVAMIKGYKERSIFTNAYWCYHDYDFSHPWYRSIESVLTKGLKYYPQDIEFYFRRANARTELKEFQNALLDYDMAILLDKTRQYEYINEAFYNRGAVRYMIGDQTGARNDFIKGQKMSGYTFREYHDYCKKWK